MRDQDTFGIALGYGHLSGGAMSNQNGTQYPSSASGTLTQLTPGAAAENFEMAIESTYLAQLTPWLAIQPDVQYIIHPGALQSSANALVLGLRATVTF